MHAPIPRRRGGAVLGGLVLAAAAAATPALAAGPQPFLAGVTSQQQPVLVRMSADGRTVARAITTLHLHCTSGASFYLPDGFTTTRVSALRRFRLTYALPAQSVDATTSITVSGSFGGQVDRTGTRVSAGTWSMTTVEKNPTTGAVTDTCTSGLVHFSAHR